MLKENARDWKQEVSTNGSQDVSLAPYSIGENVD